MAEQCKRCLRGTLLTEDDEFGNKIRKCHLCSRSPDEEVMTYEKVQAIMTGKGTEIERRKRKRKKFK